MFATSTLILALLFVASLLYAKIKSFSSSRPNYWQKLQFPHAENKISTYKLLLGKANVGDGDLEYYKQMGESGKFIGIVEFGQPTLFVKDLDLAKKIFIKDFDCFSDRRDFPNSDPLITQSLFFLKGQQWRNMRSFLSPTLTSGRIKRMFSSIEWGCSNLVSFIHQQEKIPLKLGETMRKFAVQVIALSAFGLGIDVFGNETDEFYAMVDRIGAFSRIRRIKFAIFQNFPNVAKFLGISSVDGDVTKYFGDILTSAFREREDQGDISKSGRPDDFLQFILEAKQGKLKIDERELNTEEKEGLVVSKGGKIEWSDTLANAQAFIFLVAGFNNVSNTLAIAISILSERSDIQEQLRKEVLEKSKSLSSLEYDCISELELLEMFVSEVLRLYPPVSRLERKCMKPYAIEGTNLIIPKGTIIAFPVEAIHRDEAHYSDALVFDLNRFGKTEKALRNPYAFLPFGIGPRNCIGMRLAIVEIKNALANILSQFTIKGPDNESIPPIVRQVFGYRVNPAFTIIFDPLSVNLVG